MDRSTHERGTWHLDKSISVGHILTTLIIAISAFSWGSNIDRRVAANSQSIAYLTNEVADTNNHFDAYRSDIRQDLRDIHAKLDRLIESQSYK